MNEESVIFGAKRHLYGGIEPSNLKSFQIVKANGTIRFLIAHPDDTVIDGQTLCTVEGAWLLRRTDRYPENEFDGEFVADVKKGFTYEMDDDGIDYKYAAFPYSTHNVFNRSSVNRFTGEPITNISSWQFGYDIDMNDPNPDTRVSYPTGVDNELYAPAYLDRTDGIFKYGHWPEKSGLYFMPKPCLMDLTNNHIKCYLQDNDYNKSVSGEDMTSYITGEQGNYSVMMEWPYMYTARWIKDGVYHFRCANYSTPAPVGAPNGTNDWTKWLRVDADGALIPKFYTSVYHCVSYYRSLSGESAKLSSVRSPSSAISAGTVNDCTPTTFVDFCLITDLLNMMFKNTRRLVDRLGSVESGSNASGTGASNQKGLFWGSFAKNTPEPFKIFGMERFLCSSSNWLAVIVGLFQQADKFYYKATVGTSDGSAQTGYTPLSTTGYKCFDYQLDMVNRYPSTTSEGGKYCHYVHYTVDAGLMIPKWAFSDEVHGSKTTYYCSEFNGMYSTSTDMYSLFAGAMSDYYTTKGNKTFSAAYNTWMSCKPKKGTVVYEND